jgi:hypothetical protein
MFWLIEKFTLSLSKVYLRRGFFEPCRVNVELNPLVTVSDLKACRSPSLVISVSLFGVNFGSSTLLE